MTSTVGRFTTVDDTKDVSWFIAFSDRANALPDYLGVRQSLIAELGSLAGKEVLDVGCGAGDNTRELAALVGPSGRVVGVDLSESMLAEARRRGGTVEFGYGDMHALPFPDESFDRVRVKLTRQHSPDLDAADDELVRVLRPGGRLAAFDLDFETLMVDHPDKATTRKIAQYWADHHRQSWCARQMTRRFAARGLTDVTVVPHTVRMTFDFFLPAMDGVLSEAVTSGALDVSADEWWQPLKEAEADGHFFSAITGYVAAGTR